MIKEIEGTNLVAVKVAPDACNYKFGKWIFGEKIYPKDLFYDTEENIWNVGNEILPRGEYKVVGEVRKGKIGFDVEPYVENNGLGCYDNYKGILDNKYTCLTKEESFYSRLAANGIYFENPLHKITAHDYAFYLGDEPTLNKEWQSYEDRIVEKLLIIEKIR